MHTFVDDGSTKKEKKNSDWSRPVLPNNLPVLISRKTVLQFSRGYVFQINAQRTLARNKGHADTATRRQQKVV